MPELPEVETSCRGIAPHIEGETISSVVVRNRKLRWPISFDIDEQLPGATVTSVGRRAKYLLINTTNGTAIMHHNFYEYEFLRGKIPGRANGVMIASEPGQVTAYALDSLGDRGTMFVSPGDRVYAGQIVGEHCKDEDIVVNVCRGKKLTNIRSSGTDKAAAFKPARQMTMEISLEFIEDDELVEVTPDAIRLRKRMLTEHDRKKSQRGKG